MNMPRRGTVGRIEWSPDYRSAKATPPRGVLSPGRTLECVRCEAPCLVFAGGSLPSDWKWVAGEGWFCAKCLEARA